MTAGADSTVNPAPKGKEAAIATKVDIAASPKVNVPGETLTLKASLTKEYVTSGTLGWYTTLIQALPGLIDRLTEQFGIDLYERMMQDAQVSSCINALKVGVLTGGLHITPKELEDDVPEAQMVLAEEVATFCQRVIDNLETPITDVLWGFLDALMLGNKVGELAWIYAYTADDPAPKLEIRAIHLKPRDSVAFVVDMFNNVVGFIAAVPGSTVPIADGTMLLSSGAADLILPRTKFAVFTFRPVDNDPRGTSIGFSAYYPWWLKQQLFPEWLKYLAQFATASLVGYVAENASSEAVLDSQGNPQLNADGSVQVTSPEEKMVEALVKIRNGSAAGLPFGSKVDGLVLNGDGGKAFLEAFAQLDRWIAKAITGQTLATEEGTHQARAAAQVHQDVLGGLFQTIKNALVGMIVRDILHPLVEYNYGPAGLAVLPSASLGETETQDFSTQAAGYVALWNAGMIDPSQVAYVDEELGLPPRPPEAIAALQEKQQVGLEMSKAALTGLTSPNPGGDPNADGKQPAVGKGTEGKQPPPKAGKQPPFGRK